MYLDRKIGTCRLIFVIVVIARMRERERESALRHIGYIYVQWIVVKNWSCFSDKIEQNFLKCFTWKICHQANKICLKSLIQQNYICYRYLWCFHPMNHGIFFWSCIDYGHSVKNLFLNFWFSLCSIIERWSVNLFKRRK